MQLTTSTMAMSLTALSTLLTSTSALGINCRGSGLCDRASLSSGNGKIVQILRDAVYATTKDPSTTYNDGDHIICLSQTDTITLSGEAGAEADGLSGTFGISGDVSFGAGGICLFPQGTSLQLSDIRTLADKVLEHGCSTCGSVPKDWQSNDPKDGILTFNYVANPFCDGNCISSSGGSKLKREDSAKFAAIEA